MDAANAVTIDVDGQIVVAGVSDIGGSSDFAVSRYDAADGSLDTSFDTDGKVTTDFTGGNDDRGPRDRLLRRP